jgi:hypothetical protein
LVGQRRSFSFKESGHPAHLFTPDNKFFSSASLGDLCGFESVALRPCQEASLIFYVRYRSQGIAVNRLKASAPPESRAPDPS